jgi:translation elongation factor EF-Tu-like GTPase
MVNVVRGTVVMGNVIRGNVVRGNVIRGIGIEPQNNFSRATQYTVVPTLL